MSAVVKTCDRCMGIHIEAHGVRLGCRALAWKGGGVRLTPSEERLLRRLLLAWPSERLSMTDLVDALYGEREDGGPEGADNTSRVFVHRLRRKLAASLAPVELDGRRVGGKGKQPSYWLSSVEIKTVA